MVSMHTECFGVKFCISVWNSMHLNALNAYEKHTRIENANRTSEREIDVEFSCRHSVDFIRNSEALFA